MVIGDLIGRPTFLVSSFVDHHRQHCQSPRDGQNIDKIRCEGICRCQREARPFLARIWCDSDPSCWFTAPTSDTAFKDNLQVQWGSQDHYEIVRKVGRGKYSEVSASLSISRPQKHDLMRSERSSRVFTSSTTKSASSKSSNRSRRRRSSGKSKSSRTWLEVRISWPCWTWFAIRPPRSQA